MIFNIRKLSSKLKDETGATIVEFSIIMNVFLGLIFAIILWGIWLWEYNTIQHATMQASRCNILPGDGVCVDVRGQFSVDADSYGKQNAFSVAPATATGADGKGFIVTPGVDYQCVRASYQSGLASLTSAIFFFTDNAITPEICYTNP